MSSAFTPRECNLSDLAEDKPLLLSPTSLEFTPVITCPSSYTQDIFQPACYQLIQHPEYNSTLILRSEPLSDADDAFHVHTPQLHGYSAVRQIHRRIVPRRPGRDPPMEQLCTFYTEEKQGIDASPCVVILTPLLQDGKVLPYYHPDVLHLVFRYISTNDHLRVEVLRPAGRDNAGIAPKLYRTCQHLLTAIHRFSPSYTKNVFHDRLVPRDIYQDMYLLMRERHGVRCVQNWKEVTDPQKHVFEDIAIATYLILLWFYTYSREDAASPPVSSLPKSTDPGAHEDGIFNSWPRPSKGFIDMGCGNGLLTHILAWEGYAGLGIDLRARQSWAHYSGEWTRVALKTASIDPTCPVLEVEGEEVLPEGTFLIGNHADELTPWLPVLARLWNCSGYLSIPCCSWAWDCKWTRGYVDPEFCDSEAEEEGRASSPVAEDTILERIGLVDSKAGSTSTYAQYRGWAAQLSVRCGWVLECDVLRIPSTRNWAVVGRKLDSESAEKGARFARSRVELVRERGSFKAREPEGKAGREH